MMQLIVLVFRTYMLSILTILTRVDMTTFFDTILVESLTTAMMDENDHYLVIQLIATMYQQVFAAARTATEENTLWKIVPWT